MRGRAQVERGRHPGFRVRFRGFDRTQVVAALAKLSGENEEAQREIERLGAEIDALKIAVGERLEHDNQLHRALAAASKRADEILVKAEEEARQIRREAEEHGEQIIEQLRNQARTLEGQIDLLLARRREVETSIEELIRKVSDDLDRLRRQETDHPPDGALAQTG